MKPRSRSLAGAAIAIFALPVFIGLTACLPTFPVPVGNPEKSSIDPNVSGIWLLADEESFWMFEPYDKRTWLLTAFEISEDLDSCEHADDTQNAGAAEESETAVGDDPEVEVAKVSYYEEIMARLALLGSDCFEVERQPGAIKVWRTRFRGEWFMTWETRGVFDAERGFDPDEWIVWHIDTSAVDELRLGMIDTDNEIWDQIEEIAAEDLTRQDVEKVFRKHADEEGFYSDDDALIFYRVRPEHAALIADFVREGMLD